MSTYISIKEFKRKEKQLSKDIENKILNELGCDQPFVLVGTNIFKNGDLRNWRNNNVEALILSDKLPEVYHDIAISRAFKYFCVKVVIHVDDIIYRNPINDSPATLNLSESSYTFNTYEDYLRLLNETYLSENPGLGKSVAVWTNIKKIMSPLPLNLAYVELSNNLLGKDFVTLDSYVDLPLSTRKEVDRLVCPMTVYSKDITISQRNPEVFVYVEKEDILQARNKTNLYREELNKFLF